MNAAIAEPNTMNHDIVPRDRWLAARQSLLARERELTHLHDRIAAERRALPWVRIEKDYAFDTPQGRRTLADLFDGKRQLIVQHFMLGPGWEQGCPSCSYMADHADGMTPHLAQRDIAFVAVSRAPLAEIQRFHRRMGWKFAWVSSHGSDFNRDFGVTFTPEEVAAGGRGYNYGTQEVPAEESPGISVFVRDGAGAVFHTYSTYGRGLEAMMGTYAMIDLTPRGRHEDGLRYAMAWIRHHDRYEPQPARAAAATAGSCCSHDTR